MSGWVQRWWRGEAGAVGAAVSVATAPVEALYRAVVAWRARRWVGRAVAAPLPVISVGNLTVGGAGKTPFVRWVVEWLLAAGARPAVVSRGYGRDELLLHRAWYAEVPVVADPDRVAAVERAAAEGARIAVVDDGFQHLRLARDLDLVLVAAETPFPGRVLPRGPYREGPGALARAGAVIVTRKSARPDAAAAVAREVRRRHPGLPLARVWYRPGGWVDLDGRAAERPDGAVHIVTAVAWPETVRGVVAAAVADTAAGAVTIDPFADHHDFTVADARRIAAMRPGSTLVVTEKDAVKLREPELRDALAGRRVAVLTLRLVWEEGRAEVESALRQLIEVGDDG